MCAFFSEDNDLEVERRIKDRVLKHGEAIHSFVVQYQALCFWWWLQVNEREMVQATQGYRLQLGK